MLKFILFVLAGAVIYVLFSYVLRLFNVTILFSALTRMFPKPTFAP